MTTRVEVVNEISDRPGVYTLVLILDDDVQVRVKSGRVFSLRSGTYIYVGSALQGLRRRLRRYFQERVRKHWHIDYLLDFAKICAVVYSEVYRSNISIRPEVLLSNMVCRCCRFVPIPGFGCTDVKTVSNLYYAGRRHVVHVVEVLQYLMKSLFANVKVLCTG